MVEKCARIPRCSEVPLSPPESDQFPSTAESYTGFHDTSYALPISSRPSKPMRPQSLKYPDQAQHPLDPSYHQARGRSDQYSFGNTASAYPYLNQLSQPKKASVNHYPLSHHQSPIDPRASETHGRQPLSRREIQDHLTTSGFQGLRPERSNSPIPMRRVRDIPWRGVL